MTDNRQTQPPVELDVLIVGAGVAGIHQLALARENGLNARVVDEADGVGGTWFWNRYPGARLDSESYSYGYFFDEQLRKEWSWSEEFVGQPELERYFNAAVDRMGLRDSIDLGVRVVGADFDEKNNYWTIRCESGAVYVARVLISAVGLLSAPQYPRVPGLERFTGESHHTARWPKEPVDFHGKRVAVIGTGSSGVQIITEIAPQVERLYVLQRTPNWCTPINNREIDAARMQALRDSYDQIHQTCMTSPQAFIHTPRPEGALDVTERERIEYLQQLWDAPGMTMYVKNFRDILTSQAANDAVSDFIAQKIKDRVRDPAIAEKLIPADHGFGMKRPVLENGYYEVFNRPHIELVDMGTEPLLEVTEHGLRTSARELEVDVVVYATGFDAVTGSIVRLGVRGTNGQTLGDYWTDGPQTNLGMMVHGFPNFFIIGGPHGPTGNNPRASEFQVQWVTSCLRHMREHSLSRIETTREAEREWVRHVNGTIRGTLTENANSWGFGSNVPGKPRAYLLYGGGQPLYRAQCREVADRSYAGLTLS